jgi:hypothetical protein
MKGWIYIQLVFNYGFLIEMIFDIYLNRSFKKAYYRNFKLWPETACQLMSFFATFMFIYHFNDVESYLMLVKLFEVVIFVRMIKLIELLNEIKVMRIILETISNIAAPMKSLLLVTLVVMYLFALLGMFLFGGLI